MQLYAAIALAQYIFNGQSSSGCLSIINKTGKTGVQICTNTQNDDGHHHASRGDFAAFQLTAGSCAFVRLNKGDFTYVCARTECAKASFHPITNNNKNWYQNSAIRSTTLFQFSVQ